MCYNVTNLDFSEWFEKGEEEAYVCPLCTNNVMKFPARNNTAFKQPQSFIVNYFIIKKKTLKHQQANLHVYLMFKLSSSENFFQCSTSTSPEGALSYYKQREDSAAADSCELCERRVI